MPPTECWPADWAALEAAALRRGYWLGRHADGPGADAWEVVPDARGARYGYWRREGGASLRFATLDALRAWLGLAQFETAVSQMTLWDEPRKAA